MKDEEKSKEQLIEELTELRQQLIQGEKALDRFTNLARLSSDWGYVTVLKEDNSFTQEWVGDGFLKQRVIHKRKS